MPKVDQPLPTPAGQRGFVQGLLKPSLPALFGTLAVALLTVLALDHFVFSLLISKLHVGYFQTGKRDEYGYVTARAIQLRRRNDPRDVVIVCGASTMRDALLEEQDVANMFEEALGHEVPVYILSGPGMSIWNQRDLVAWLSGRIRGVVVLNVSAGTLTATHEALMTQNDWLGIESVALQEHELRATQTVQGNARKSSLLHQRNYWSDRWKVLLSKAPWGPVRKLIWRPDRRSTWPKKKWDERFPKTVAGRRNDLRRFQHDPARFDVLRRCIAELKRDGKVQVVLLESTAHPRVRNELTEAYAEYRACMRRFAESNAVHYWDLHDAAELKPDDFDDTQHIGHRSAARRFTKVFSQRVARLLVEKERR